ncbi:MAG: phosphoribosylanthranilate isomerase [Acetobacteraceae bacterium]
MTKVKICGVNSAAALQAAAAAGADWVGFVFFPPSPRGVTPAEAVSVSATCPGGPLRVGLFVEPEDAAVAATLASVRLDVLQVYASVERAAALRARFGLPVWHAVGVGSRADLPVAAAGVDGLVVEAKAPAGADRPGGNAVAFDWAVLRGWQAPVPWLLAGGLMAGTVREAIRVSGAAAVDVSSGVERAPGVKDAGLIAAFVAAARAG